MSRIRVLPEFTVNRIAAGEVIERPAAAVKELVENALDAGATRIAVALDGGGIDRIEVTDNGSGMTDAELALAVLRHATSKLTDETLVQIATLGFRGEALPSIGAAARLSITSRPQPSTQVSSAHAPSIPAEPGGGDHAHTISVEGGRVSEVTPAAGAFGTRVVVRDLFFATPARRKFLKIPRTEADHAAAAVRRLALAAPRVAFRLESAGRVEFDLPAQDRAARVAALLGADTAAALLTVEASRGPLRLSGFAGAPSVTRATTVAQSFVVNGRPVSDPLLKSALRVAYRDVIPSGRHPVAALYLDLPAEELDVNVHPAKTELRFRDTEAVRSLVIGGLRRVLAGGVGGAVPVSGAGYGAASDASGAASGAASGTARPTGFAPYRPGLHLAWSRPPAGGIRALPLPGFAPHPSPTPGTGLGDPHAPSANEGGVAESARLFESGPAARLIPPTTPRADHPLGAPVAQVLDTYIIAVAADGSLVLVDQHAAHERLMHEAIRTQMLDGGVRSQPLLLPAVVDLPQPDAARLLHHADELADLGLEIEAFGPGAVLVRALPAALGAPDPAPLLRDLADELAELEQTTALAVRLEAVIARLACHGSIRAGRRLAAAEMDALLRQMEQTPRAATCSHGRPTVLKLSRAEIEKLFGRR